MVAFFKDKNAVFNGNQRNQNTVRARSRKLCHSPTILTPFFFFLFSRGGGGWGSWNQLPRPSSARQRNAVEMAFRWRADVRLTLNVGWAADIFHGIRTSISKEPYSIRISKGSPDPLPHLTGSAHALFV